MRRKIRALAAQHRAESALRGLFRPVYPRWHHDSREMVRTFLNSSGDLEVTDSQLRVTLEAGASIRGPWGRRCNRVRVGNVRSSGLLPD